MIWCLEYLGCDDRALPFMNHDDGGCIHDDGGCTPLGLATLLMPYRTSGMVPQ